MRSAEIDELCRSAYREFSDVSDFIWKAPTLIEEQTKLEAEKLTDYFPLTGNPERDDAVLALRAQRWRYESPKLQRTFPYLIATGNLFSSMALFETYALILCKKIESELHTPLSNTPGQGISRSYNYLKYSGARKESAPFCQQITVALRFRNCIFHASGILNWSREDTSIRDDIASGRFLSVDHRKTHDQDRRDQLVRIVDSSLGNRLQLSNDYVHTLVYYLREHFCDLCTQCSALEPP